MLKKIAAVCGLMVITLLLLAVGMTVYANADSRLSIAVFHLGYRLVPFTESYLTLYSPLRRDVSAGYIPSEVDDFLCGRVESTTDPAEFDAIVNFYALQAGGREGTCIFRTNDMTREKIAGRIVANLSKSDDEWPLVLLEEVRLGKSLGKGNLGQSPGATSWPSTPEERKAWHKDALTFAGSKYIEWWEAESTWDEKKRIDPLAGQLVRINECCG